MFIILEFFTLICDALLPHEIPLRRYKLRIKSNNRINLTLFLKREKSRKNCYVTWTQSGTLQLVQWADNKTKFPCQIEINQFQKTVRFLFYLKKISVDKNSVYRGFWTIQWPKILRPKLKMIIFSNRVVMENLGWASTEIVIIVICIGTQLRWDIFLMALF